MLSLGACIVGREEEGFYVEIAPITRAFQPEALAVAGFDLDALAVRGADPAEAMAAFDAWLARQVPEGRRPVFVARPLAFDWMFVAYYFHRFLGRNPFGHAGLDVRSFQMGLTFARPDEGGSEPEASLGRTLVLTHNALEDAIAQSRLFGELLARAART
jgi:hypothetical protein